MLEQLIAWDKSLFLFLNGSDSSYIDQLMWVYTGKLIWLPLILAFVYQFWKRGWKEALLAIVFMALVITFCDQITSSFFKPYFQRFRPAQDPEFRHLVDIVHNYRGGKYGFISSHAANSFGLVVFTTLLFRYRFYTITAIIWATINSYSRIYLGVHYPGDILVGAAVGVLIGWVLYKAYESIHYSLYIRRVYNSKEPIYRKDQSPVLSLAIYATFILILIIAPYITERI